MSIPRHMSNEDSKAYAALVIYTRQRAVADGYLFGLHNRLKGTNNALVQTG